MFFKFFYFFLSLFFLVNCSQFKTLTVRNPANQTDQREFNEIITELNNYSNSKKKNDNLKCRDNFNIFYKELFQLAGNIKLNDTSDISLADQDIERSFKTRLRFSELIKNQGINPDCLKSIKDVYYVLRLVEDYLIGERMEKSIASSIELKSLTGSFPYLKINPDFQKEQDLKLGDLVLFDQNDFSSAINERRFEGDFYYAQMGEIIKDEKTQDLRIKIHFLETGIKFLSTEEFLDQNHGRVLVLRHVGDLKTTEGQMTKVNEGLIGFFKNFPNISQTHPSLETLQFSSQYKIVKEWINPRKIIDSRLNQMILTKIFNEIEKNAYMLDPRVVTSTASRNHWTYKRQSYLDNKSNDPKATFQLGQKEIDLLLTLDKLGEEVFKIIDKKSLELDRPMTPFEIIVALENIFTEDIQVFKSYIQGQDVVKPAFHLMFHP